MSRLRYALERDANEPAIIRALTQVGCTVEKIDGKPYDLIVGLHGVNYLMEVKTAKGRLKPSQAEFITTWRGQWRIVRTVDEALAVVIGKHA